MEPDRRAVSITIPSHVYLKHLSADTGIPIRELLEQAIDLYREKMIEAGVGPTR